MIANHVARFLTALLMLMVELLRRLRGRGQRG